MQGGTRYVLYVVSQHHDRYPHPTPSPGRCDRLVPWNSLETRNFFQFILICHVAGYKNCVVYSVLTAHTLSFSIPTTAHTVAHCRLTMCFPGSVFIHSNHLTEQSRDWHQELCVCLVIKPLLGSFVTNFQIVSRVLSSVQFLIFLAVHFLFIQQLDILA